MECLLPYLHMVTVPHIMVRLERMLDYRGFTVYLYSMHMYYTENTSLLFSCHAMGYFTPPVGWIVHTNRKEKELHGGCDREDNRLQEAGGDQHKGVCLPSMTCDTPIIPYSALLQ